MKSRQILLHLAAGLAGFSLLNAMAQTPPAPERQRQLIRMVRQDCGSCHGMRLTGGLGPALTHDALADKPLESLVATISQGRRGTPMPGWQVMLNDSEALWIAQQLQNGFPEEERSAHR